VKTGDGSLKRVQDARNITLCAQPAPGPILRMEPPGYMVGAEADMMAEVANRLGIAAFTYRRFLFTAQFPQLGTRECDVFVSAIAALTSRARWPGVTFTAPYRVHQRVIVVRADSPYQGAQDLRGAALAGLAGSETFAHAQQLAERLGGATTVLEFADERSILRALAERTAAAFIDSSHNVPLIDRAHDVRALPDVLRFVPSGDLADEAAQSPYHYGALAAMTRAEDGDLNLALSVAFAEMIADGSLRSILRKWNVDSSAAFDLIRPEVR
jgi:ABC-type amino acid transport substrate-binding protein